MPAISSALYKNPENPWEMIDTPGGRMEAWRAATVLTGETGAAVAYLQQTRADAAFVHDALNAREDAVGERERNVSAREDAVGKREDEVRSMAADARAAFDAVKKYAEAQREEPPVAPPGTKTDEGELEPHPPKTDLEGNLREPENSELNLKEDQGGEVEFAQPDPDKPQDPDLSRAPAAFEDV